LCAIPAFTLYGLLGISLHRQNYFSLYILAHTISAQVEVLSAVIAGMKDVRAQISQQYGDQTVRFVDEVHRLSKAQQDAFLPRLESGVTHLYQCHNRQPFL